MPELTTNIAPVTPAELEFITSRICTKIIKPLTPNSLGDQLAGLLKTDKNVYFDFIEDCANILSGITDTTNSPHWTVNTLKQFKQTVIWDFFAELCGLGSGIKIQDLAQFIRTIQLGFLVADVYSDPHIEPIIKERTDSIEIEFIRILESLVED